MLNDVYCKMLLVSFNSIHSIFISSNCCIFPPCFTFPYFYFYNVQVISIVELFCDKVLKAISQNEFSEKFVILILLKIIKLVEML